MKSLFFYLVMGLLFYYCKDNRMAYQVSKYNDTIAPPSGYGIQEKNCKKAMQGFTKKYNVNLSKFYISDKGSAFNKKDSVSIAKPFYTQINSFENCFPEESFPNLLLVYNHIDTKTKVYRNALYVDEPNTFQEIIPDKNGFVISTERGNSSKVISKVKVSYKSGVLYVNNIDLESSGFNQYRKKYNFNNLKLESHSVKMIDSLQSINEVK